MSKAFLSCSGIHWAQSDLSYKVATRPGCHYNQLFKKETKITNLVVDCCALYVLQHCNSLHCLTVTHLFGRKIQNGLPKGNKASPKENIFQRLQEINRLALRVNGWC